MPTGSQVYAPIDSCIHSDLISISKQYGVTPPISVNSPTERELEMTQDLIGVLRATGFFEEESESEKRYPIHTQIEMEANWLVRSYWES